MVCASPASHRATRKQAHCLPLHEEVNAYTKELQPPYRSMLYQYYYYYQRVPIPKRRLSNIIDSEDAAATLKVMHPRQEELSVLKVTTHHSS